MNKIKNHLLIAFILLAVVYVLVNFVPISAQSIEGDNLGLFSDPHELEVYQDRGSWILKGEFPYEAGFEEYPELAVWLFGLFNLAAKYINYAYIFYFIMALFLFGTFYIVLKLLEIFKKNYCYAWLLFLPSALYFSFNRFDIIPVFLVVLSIYLFLKTKYKYSFLILSIAFLFKWYALVLLTIFIIAILLKNKKIKPLILPCLVFTVPVCIVFGTTIVSAGWNNFIQPYTFHMDRFCELGNIWGTFYFYILNSSFQEQTFFCSNITIFLQIVLPILLFVWYNIRRRKGLNNQQIVVWSTIFIICFIFFSRLFSNQWEIWYLPLLIILISKNVDIVLIVAFDILNYITFPIITRYIPTGIFSNQLFPLHMFNAFSMLLMVIMILIIYRLIKQVKKDEDIHSPPNL